jgi:DNA primase small subunit
MPRRRLLLRRPLRRRRPWKRRQGPMPEDDGGLIRTTRWLVKRFGTYYQGTDLRLPPRYTRREWAFLYFDKSFMIRHLAFRTRPKIEDYVRTHVPRHVYYSTAYYEDPSARTMVEKGWQGATLIFDLDADHLEGASQMEYGEMLAEVKKEFVKLVDRWLIDKLGYDAGDIGIVFSGGRGYHAHVEDKRVWELNAFERREVVDLVTGKADLSNFLVKEPFHSGTRMDGKGYSSRTPKLPDPAFGDWRGDLAKATLKFFSEIDATVKEGRREEAIMRLAEIAEMGEEEASGFLDLLEQPDDADRRRIDRLLQDRRIDLQQGIGEKFWQRIAEKLFVQMAGEADEPVTADTKRLIRLPSSLHGKSGFRVVELTRDELDHFDPLTDSLAFGSEPVEVEAHQDMDFQLGGEAHVLSAGKRTTLPEHAAVFACLRGWAQIPGA